MTARLTRACAVVVLLAVTACTQDSPTPDRDTPSSSSTSAMTTKPAPPTPTARQTTLDRRDAKLRVSIEQLRGGVERSRWPALMRAMGKPVTGWIEGAYGGSYPRMSYDRAFQGWTWEAARLARGDGDTTTNYSDGKELTGVVFERRVVRFYVFASSGRTGGATAKVDVRFTGDRNDGRTRTERVLGNLYLTRVGRQWQVFGYDLSRLELRR